MKLKLRERRMGAPFGWFGGKQIHCKHLLKYIPPHYTYIEVFGGSGALLFAKPLSKTNVYNDLDHGLTNFFRVLRDKKQFKKLHRLISMTQFSRVEYNTMRYSWKTEKDPVKKAHQFFVVARQSFAGHIGHSWSYNIHRPVKVNSWLSLIEELPKFHEKMMHVQVDEKDWRDVLNTYDYEDAFFYLDPPYVPDTRKRGKYRFEMSYEDHDELVMRLLTLKGKCMLSGYKNSLYEELIVNGWNYHEWSARTNAVYYSDEVKELTDSYKDPEIQHRTESIWFNYSLENKGNPSLFSY